MRRQRETPARDASEALPRGPAGAAAFRPLNGPTLRGEQVVCVAASVKSYIASHFVMYSYHHYKVEY